MSDTQYAVGVRAPDWAGRWAVTAVAVVLGVALALRLLWAVLVDPDITLENDAGWYDYFARSIAAGDGYRHVTGEPTAFWPVGWPAALAVVYRLTGDSVLAGKLLNVFLSTATVGLVYLLGRRWWGHRPALAAAAILALMPGPITFTSLLISETLFTALFTAALAILAWAGRDRPAGVMRAAAFGVVVGLTTYVRGQALLLPLLAVAWLALAGRPWRESLRFGLVGLAVTAAVLLPWTVRNAVQLGEPVLLSTNTGINLWTGHHQGADGGLDFPDQAAYTERFAGLPEPERELAINREATRDAVRYALTRPVDEVRLTAVKFVRLYFDDADGLRWNERYGEDRLFPSPWRYVLYGVTDAYYWAVGALAFAGLAVGLRRDRSLFAPVALVLVYWTVVHLAFFGEPRFHVPVLPLFALLAAYGGWQAAAWLRPRLPGRVGG